MSGEYRELLLDHVGVTGARQKNIWREALELALGAMAGPVVDEYPTITPEVWSDMKCRDGRRCHCPFCMWETRNRPRCIEWERLQQYRWQPAKVFPFGSDADVASKLEAYARDGATAPSYLGPCLDRVRDEASLGARVVKAPSSGRDPAGIYHASLRADCWRAYVTALSRDEVRQGASTAETVRVTVAAQLGHDVDEEHVALARRGRHAVKVELAARELTPPPPPRAARMARAVEARREELATRRV